jgi:hypothetical protein
METRPPRKSAGRGVVERAVEAGLNFVPGVGGALAVAFVTAVSWSLNERRERWLAGLAGQVDDLGGRMGDADFRNLVRWANERSSPVLSLDIPSGLDATTARIGKPCVRATATLTLALPKTGLVAAPVVGELYVADISVPPSLYREKGIGVPQLFNEALIVRLEP